MNWWISIIFSAFLLMLSSVARAETYLLIITGLPGETAYSETFADWAGQLIQYAEASDLDSERLIYLSPSPPPDVPYQTGPADRAGIETVLAELAEQIDPQDQLWLVLFGHGSVQGKRALFNISGPDIDSARLAKLLAPIKAEKIVLVNTTAASGAFLQDLAGPNRVLISSTRSGSERYFSYFGGYWVAAFDAAQGGDLDKDGRISLLEAFRYARSEVERRYREEKRLQTEHAILDDSGDGRGSAEPQANNAEDGSLAARTFLIDYRDIAASDPVRADLLARQQTIEQQLQDWMARKSTLATESYYQQLENLLVDLTQVDRALRAYE